MASLGVLAAVFAVVQLARGHIVNMALNKPTSMDPTLNSSGIVYSSDKGVNGDRSGSLRDLVRTGTNKEPFVWWLLDLETVVEDAVVMIYFAYHFENSRPGLMVFTSQTSPSQYPDGRYCGTVRDITQYEVNFTCTGSWRYVMLYKEVNYISVVFAELEVLVCTDGTYGENCDKQCGSRMCRSTSGSCNRTNGACSGGCKDGWRDTDCTMKCPPGTYGQNCDSTCGKCLDDACNHVTGNCPGYCKPGWKGDLCDQKTWTDMITFSGNCSGCQVVSYSVSDSHDTPGLAVVYLLCGLTAALLLVVLVLCILLCLAARGKLRWPRGTGRTGDTKSVELKYNPESEKPLVTTK